MKILIAADSFKDALPAFEVCEAIRKGIVAANPQAEIVLCPLSDGGEGIYDVLAIALGLEEINLVVSDPLFRPIQAAYGLSADGKTAFIEMAKTAGLQLLSPEERNPWLSTSFGVGRQMADAIQRGVRHIVLAIGGSATNDAGIGMAAALGWRFLDENNTELPPTGGSLGQIRSIVPPAVLPDVDVQVICDVNNPLFGSNGAAFIYARQKGADDFAIEQLDHGLQHFARILQETGARADPDSAGAGAAGGMGFGALYFLNGVLRPGVDVVLDLLHVDQKLAWADLVITGEGKIDGQTANGKLIQGLSFRAAKFGKPVVALCGLLDAGERQIRQIGLQAAYSINDPGEGADLQNMLKNTARNLEKTARRISINP